MSRVPMAGFMGSMQPPGCLGAGVVLIPCRSVAAWEIRQQNAIIILVYIHTYNTARSAMHPTLWFGPQCAIIGYRPPGSLHCVLLGLQRETPCSVNCASMYVHRNASVLYMYLYLRSNPNRQDLLDTDST
jgi:hypothetical protein